MQTTKIRDEIYAQIDECYLTVYNAQHELMKIIAKRELARRLDPSTRNELTHYEFRLEMSGVGFVCRWLHIKFYHNNGKLVRIAKSVPIPKNGVYKKNQFKYAEEWELDIIIQFESMVSTIRAYVKHLVKAHTLLIYANKSLGVNYEVIDTKKRLDLPKLSMAKVKKSML